MTGQKNGTPGCIGMLAHVDAGKTTLCEALLYTAGTLRSLGRVDHGNAYLDTDAVERERGITVFSKQARFSMDGRDFTLIDTPGHTDFSTEAERVLPVLDAAVLVISAADGVQAHTLTLWKLLEQYRVPTVLFINKMDLPDTDAAALMAHLRARLDGGCVDFGGDPEQIAEAAAMCEESTLEEYLQTGTVSSERVQGLIARRKLFPCYFGTALKLQGVAELAEGLCRWVPAPTDAGEFGARIYKISRDPQGNRLTWLKLTGGTLRVRDTVCYPADDGEKQEKIQAIRLYSGEKFTTANEICPGTVCAVVGLSGTCAGQGLGREPSAPKAVLQPVMTYRVTTGMDPLLALPKLRQLEEEEPQLHLLWDGENRQISVQIMGTVQAEVFRNLAARRFSMEVGLSDPKICYLETIENTVEGVGHFEPLRHYAEVHLLLEPLPRGSGLEFDTQCSTDILAAPYQKLILTHLAEKAHRGVLTGAPITDIRLTLVAGRAHLKHTEGGDMRQATYRAVRQGLMQAKSLLLEPWYDFTLTVDAASVGRAITDIRAMSGEFDPPQTVENMSVLRGILPAAELGDYAQVLASYTHGKGQLQISLHGYLPCHNGEKIIAGAQYDPEADLENTPDSVFCAHGAGFSVKWNRVPEYMHLQSYLKAEKAPQLITRNLSADDKELEKIMEREFGPIKRPQYTEPANRSATETLVIQPPRQQYLLVDGYNVLFAEPKLAQLAQADLDAARRQLCDRLSSYAAYKKCRLVVIFDGWKVKGNPGQKEEFAGIRVVYTRENQTADAYIESLIAQIGNNYHVRVATSDALVQLSGLRSGVLRVSARELWEELDTTAQEMHRHFQKK